MRTHIASKDRLDRPGRRERRAARLRLRRVDALSAQLAELHAIRAMLGHATEIVRGGWIQGAWFAVDVGGRTRAVTAPEMRLTTDNPVTGACLVGAVVQAGGGPGAVRSQPVQRALDLVWHTLREDSGQSVRWCPGPPVRMIHVLDLTHWNDAPDRTRGDVVQLLESSVVTADAQQERCRAEQAALAASFTTWPARRGGPASCPDGPERMAGTGGTRESSPAQPTSHR
jgi:hypothetical protein